MSKKRIYYPLLQCGFAMEKSKCERCLGTGLIQENNYIGNGFIETHYIYCDCEDGGKARKSNEKK